MESLDTGERVDRKNYYGPKVISLHTNKEKKENLHMYSFKVPVNRVQQNPGFPEADTFADMIKTYQTHGATFLIPCRMSTLQSGYSAPPGYHAKAVVFCLLK